MTIREELNQALKDAMKAQDEDRKRVCRMALSSIKYIEKDKKRELDEGELLDVIQKEIKIRKETLLDAEKADRPETIETVKNDIKILEEFLPKQLSLEELREIVKSAIEKAEAKSPSDMGKVMKLVMPEVKGKAANDVVSKTVKELLAEA